MSNMFQSCPGSLFISNCGTRFINGEYFLDKSKFDGKNNKMIRYVRQCMHPRSNRSFRLEIVKKSLPQFSGNNNQYYVIQGCNESNGNGNGNGDRIDYYMSDQQGNWTEIAGLNPLPSLSSSNNIDASSKQSQTQKQQSKQKQQHKKQQQQQQPKPKPEPKMNNENQGNKGGKQEASTTPSSLHNNEDSKSCDNVEPTYKRYLLNTYQFSNDKDCKIVGFGNDSKHGQYILVNDTIFHSQGGGQPSDIGTIESKDGKIIFNVTFVANNNGIIHHFGNYANGGENGTFNINDEIIEKVNENNRKECAKCHSAGHLLDIGLSLMGYGSKVLKPTKGYHFLKGSYVEYEGNIDANERENVRTELEKTINKMIQEKVDSKMLLLEKEEYCKNYIDGWNLLSENEKKKTMDSLYSEFGKIRVITWDTDDDRWNNASKIAINEIGCMCGGTHIDNTQRIEKVEITKIKKKGKNMRVMYSVA